VTVPAEQVEQGDGERRAELPADHPKSLHWVTWHVYVDHLQHPQRQQHALVKMDLTDCDQLAYSEVRAAREAECHYSPQLCSWFKRQCAKNTATRSTSVCVPCLAPFSHPF
jgi:hypothetical protein